MRAVAAAVALAGLIVAASLSVAIVEPRGRSVEALPEQIAEVVLPPRTDAKDDEKEERLVFGPVPISIETSPEKPRGTEEALTDAAGDAESSSDVVDDGPAPPVVPNALARLSRQMFDGSDTDRVRAVRTLGNLGTPARKAVPDLAKVLREGRPELRSAAAKALGQIGKPAVPVLIEALRDEDGAVRLQTARALGRAGPDAKEAVAALIASLKDGRESVRQAAADALGEMGPDAKEAASPLTRLFHDPSPQMRQHARAALGQIGPTAVEPLCAALNADKREVRLDALQTLALFGREAKAAVPSLRQALQDDDPKIRAAAADALGAMRARERRPCPNC